MSAFLLAAAVSFGVIFVAELGDKSQLMALTFATRYRPLHVLVGISIATTVVHALSVLLGHQLGTVLPTEWISIAAGVAFLVFAAWTLRGDRLTDNDKARVERTARSAIIAVTVAFFLAELGDKTMLATITLATQYDAVGSWLGSTLGMVAADAIAILVGRQIGRKVPERVVAIGAACLFAVFGVWILLDTVPHVIA